MGLGLVPAKQGWETDENKSISRKNDCGFPQKLLKI
jgi:hypothetical protein